MITGAGLMASIIGDGVIYHITQLMCFWRLVLDQSVIWMNDSGFWVVQKLSGFTEKEMLKTWSVLLTVISIVGVVLALLIDFLSASLNLPC